VTSLDSILAEGLTTEECTQVLAHIERFNAFGDYCKRNITRDEALDVLIQHDDFPEHIVQHIDFTGDILASAITHANINDIVHALVSVDHTLAAAMLVELTYYRSKGVI